MLSSNIDPDCLAAAGYISGCLSGRASEMFSHVVIQEVNEKFRPGKGHRKSPWPFESIVDVPVSELALQLEEQMVVNEAIAQEQVWMQERLKSFPARERGTPEGATTSVRRMTARTRTTTGATAGTATTVLRIRAAETGLDLVSKAGASLVASTSSRNVRVRPRRRRSFARSDASPASVSSAARPDIKRRTARTHRRIRQTVQ